MINLNEGNYLMLVITLFTLLVAVLCAFASYENGRTTSSLYKEVDRLTLDNTAWAETNLLNLKEIEGLQNQHAELNSDYHMTRASLTAARQERDVLASEMATLIEENKALRATAAAVTRHPSTVTPLQLVSFDMPDLEFENQNTRTTDNIQLSDN